MSLPPEPLATTPDPLGDYLLNLRKNVETIGRIVAINQSINSDLERIGAALRSMARLAERRA